MKLTSPRRVKAMLEQYGIRPSKGLGQNFLINEHVLEAIISAAQPEPQDLVVEIGPGIGTLTAALAPKAGRVVAIEKDEALAPLLRQNLYSLPGVELIFADSLQISYGQLVKGAQRKKVVANLPYYVTTPLIMRLVRQNFNWESLVLMVQAEAAERLLAAPGQKNWDLLGAVVACLYEVKPVMLVGAHAFYPRPRVGSAVVRLEAGADMPLKGSRDNLWRLMEAAFGQRRKTLANALEHNLALEKERLGPLLDKLGLDRRIRGEHLTPNQFIDLANLLDDEGSKERERH